MMATVFIVRAGMSFNLLNKAERYTHAIAEFTILICGLLTEFAGLQLTPASPIY